MEKNLQKFLKERLSINEGQSSDKIMTTGEAVRKFVKPGMSIQVGSGMAYPTVSYYETIRQYWGKDPGFTLISMSGSSLSSAIFVHGGLCRKIISAYNGDSYPFPLPNPIFSKAYQEKKVIFEDWTMLTLFLRLMAGAMGVPFLPTKSICGSSMENENKDTFRVIDDPFGEESPIGIVKALNPDISLVHGWASDPEGNTIIAPAYAGKAYGALAAKQGVIVTVEKIVDSDFIRKHSDKVKIPSYVVKAVCEEPMGAHPGGLYPMGIPEFQGYGEDQEFIFQSRQACRNLSQFQDWIDKWVLNMRDHGDYLKALGKDRIFHLRGRIQEVSWISELSDLSETLSSPEKPTPSEYMIIGAKEKLTQIIKEKQYKNILCGIGASNLAAWLAYYELRHEGNLVNIMAELGFYGYSPIPADPNLFNFRNLPSCQMMTDIVTVMGIFLSGSQASSIGVLGAGQIDRFGNVNSTKMPEFNQYLVGSGGGNDTASGACDVMITVEQNALRYVDKVSYITSPGDKVSTVVSQLGIYEKDRGKEELVLTGYFPFDLSKSEQDAIREIKEQCGWELKVHPQIQALPLPTQEDLKFLRCFDPQRFFTGSKGDKRRESSAK